MDAAEEMHERVVAAFQAGWRAPHPRAWDGMITEDYTQVQPMLRPGSGRRHWHSEVARLLALLPDLSGEVTAWAGRGPLLFLEMSCSATLGGRPVRFRLVDRMILDGSGRATQRETFLDTHPSFSPC